MENERDPGDSPRRGSARGKWVPAAAMLAAGLGLGILAYRDRREPPAPPLPEAAPNPGAGAPPSDSPHPEAGAPPEAGSPPAEASPPGAPLPGGRPAALFPIGSFDEPPPSFEWTRDPAATSYRLEVRDAAEVVVWSAETADTTRPFPAPELSGRAGAVLSWRVVPLAHGRELRPSESLRFRFGG